MQTAVLDLGTNTFKILMVESQANHKHQTTLELKLPVNLALGGLQKNILSESAFRRGYNAMCFFKENIIDLYQPHKVLAYATSGIRSTDNGQEFVEYIKRELGIEIEIISGEKEAELIYYGVRQAVEWTDDHVLLLDIGGGSCEFLIVNREQIKWKQSFKIGASRLLEHFKAQEPISKETVSEIERFLEQKLKPLFEEVHSGKYGTIQTLVGSSGSFDSFARMVAADINSTETKMYDTYSSIEVSEYLGLHKKLLKSTPKERKLMKGLILTRVEMIVLSSIIVNFIIKRLTINKMYQSAFSMKEGMMWDLIDKKQL